MKKLSDLKNIGNTSALWLNTVGIYNLEQLKAMGAVEAYVKIHQRGIKVSKVLLYAIHGALQDTHWNELDKTIKQQLVDEAKKKTEFD